MRLQKNIIFAKIINNTWLYVSYKTIRFMGIISSSKRNNSMMQTTKGLYFGTAQAEGECVEEKGHKINPYFIDYLKILDDVQNNKFIIIGRKGTGKSAIAQFIENECDKTQDSYAHSVSVANVEIERIIQLANVENGDSLVFEWLILLYLTKLIVKSGSAKYAQAVQKLSNFLSKNTGSVEIDQKQMVEILTERKGNVDINMLATKFQAQLGTMVKNTNPSFINLLTPLTEIVHSALRYQDMKNKEFWILFDDLDVNYNLNNEEDNNKLMDLVRTVSKFNNQLPKNARVLLFIRDDVADRLAPKYSDSAKIFESHSTRINWYIHGLNKINEEEVPLKMLVNQRIKRAFKNKGISIPKSIVPWDYLIDKEIGNPKSSFKYLLDYSFYKPRDFVIFLNTIGDDAYKYPLTSNDLEKVLGRYCKKMKDEILSELTLFFNDKEKQAIYDIIFQHIVNDIRDHKYTSFSDLAKYIDKTSDFTMKGKNVLEILWNYSLIGYKDEKGGVYYKHREDDLPISVENALIELPNCIKRLYKL